MKTFLTLPLVLFAFTTQAQVLTLSDDQGNTLNGTAQYVYGDVNAGPMEKDPVCTLNGSVPKVINVRRFETQLPAGITFNNFCWGECYNSDTSGEHPVWYAPQTVTLYPATQDHGFHSYYDPNGTVGVASFRYVWFNNMDVNDSAWMDIVFVATPAGINALSGTDRQFEAFPNPSLTSAVTFSCDAARSNEHRALMVYSALGELVLSKTIAPSQRSLALGEGELGEGIWFAALEVNGRAVMTRRLVITGR